MICAYLAAAVLVGLVGNAAFGAWWLDPVAAFVIAGLIVAGALLLANPRKRWGDPAAGACPACGSWTLRQDTVVPADPGSGSLRNAPKGVVTLCDTKGCAYASATVTTASRAR